ncbi:MAG: 3-deoxy-8-phosphooctulonate synthase [Planctomycetota bacterium]|jgi:2-dehydro-3-deoxyphosphooctonate aldolase (KDO 8-P synthase)
MTLTIPTVTIRSSVAIGGDLPALIMGPCVIESRDHCLRMADAVATAATNAGLPAIFKASFDKANRTSIDSFRGPGLDEGLRILDEARNASGLPITTDVHETSQVAALAEVVDLIQVPAFLCRQTDLIVACAQSGLPISIKKGQFLAPWDMRQVVSKFYAAGGRDLILMERGSTFGYNNLVSDLRSLPMMRGLGCPVIYDGTHSVQMPGGQGGTSGGAGHLAPGQMRAALAVGCEGLFLEVHDDPASAKSDGPNMIKLSELPALLEQVVALHQALGRPAVPVPCVDPVERPA